MPVNSRFTSFVRNLLLRDRVERDLDDELRAYVEMTIEEKRTARLARRVRSSSDR